MICVPTIGSDCKTIAGDVGEALVGVRLGVMFGVLLGVVMVVFVPEVVTVVVGEMGDCGWEADEVVGDTTIFVDAPDFKRAGRVGAVLVVVSLVDFSGAGAGAAAAVVGAVVFGGVVIVVVVSAITFVDFDATLELLEVVLEEVAGVVGVFGCTISMTSFGILKIGILSPMYPCCL